MSVIPPGYTSEVTFYLNGRLVVARDAEPGEFLIHYLRERQRLTGTKLVCAEGACGACSVILTRYDPIKQRLSHKAVNSCLYPVCACHGCAITTVEGLGTSDNLGAVQKAIADANGSQCGFCTPGFVTSVEALRQEHPDWTGEQLETAIDGNLCRCTGYRPILQAIRSLGKCDGKGGCGCGHHDHKEGDLESLCPSKAKGVFTDLEALRKISSLPLAVSSNGVSFYAPRDLETLLHLKSVYPEARILCGNSEIGVETRAFNKIPPVIIHVTNIPDVHFIRYTDEGLVIGAAETLIEIDEFITAEAPKIGEHKCQAHLEMHKVLQRFACRQIRNVASLAGNLCTSSPTSDLLPILLAMDAKIRIRSEERGERIADINGWFLGYRKINLLPDEVVIDVTVPYCKPGEYVQDFKLSRRKEDDINISNVCYRVMLKEVDAPLEPRKEETKETGKEWHNPNAEPCEKKDETLKDAFKPKDIKFVPCAPQKHSFVVESFKAGIGSMSVTAISSPSAAELAVGKRWDSDIVSLINDAVAKDTPIPPNAPGGCVSLRRIALRSLFFRFFLDVTAKTYGPEAIPSEYRSALDLSTEDDRKPTSAEATYDEDELTDEHSVHASIKHLSADKQAAGEAIFVDDVRPAADELHCVPILSTRAHALIKKIDTKKALLVPGVVGVFTAKDIPGKNLVEEDSYGEELWASKEVHYFGMYIGVVAAETHEAAKKAAKLVEVEYEDLPAIFTIEEAIEKKSFMSPWFGIKRGNPEEEFKKCEHVLEGTAVCEAQDQFYLEPQSSIVTPGEGGEFHILASTQNPKLTQAGAALVLGVSENHITAGVKRAGGGFGGKEARSVPISSSAAVVAYCTKRRCRMVLDRPVDMMTHGTRHPFLGKYRIGFDSKGKVQAYQVEMYSNGGHSLDLSIAILHRAIFLGDNAYYIPNFKIDGVVCRTNRPSNTAFRGFGGPQGMYFVDCAMQHVADYLGIPAHVVRKMNFYHEGDETHYRKKLIQCRMDATWDECLANSKYDERLAEVEKFNSQNRFVKRGLAILPVKFGLAFTHAPLNQAGALVHVYTDGTVLVSHGGCEIGQGIHTKMAQVAAQALRIPVSKVHITETFTDRVANTSATAASMTADLNGQAVKQAAETIRARLDEFEESLPEKRQRTWEELVVSAYNHRIDMSAHGFYTAEYGYNFKTQEGKVFAYYTYGACAAEVELDVLTGVHRIRDLDLCIDIGKSLNPALDVGQVEGALMQGIGYATIERILYDNKGRLGCPGPGKYKVPGPGDVPEHMHISLLKEAENPFAVHSSKGVGEPPLYLGHAVYWALHEAVKAARKDEQIGGYLQMTLPATVERLRVACRDCFTDPYGIEHAPGCWIEEYPPPPDTLVQK